MLDVRNTLKMPEELAVLGYCGSLEGQFAAKRKGCEKERDEGKRGEKLEGNGRMEENALEIS